MNKCDKCNEDGMIRKVGIVSIYPYYIYCDCEYGRHKKEQDAVYVPTDGGKKAKMVPIVGYSTKRKNIVRNKKLLTKYNK